VDPKNLKARVCSCGCGRELRDVNGYPDFGGRMFFAKECLAKDKAWRIAAQRALQKTKETPVRFGSNYVARCSTKESAAALQDAIAERRAKYGPVKVKAKGAAE
jgi:hypothetical protein